MIYLTCLFNYNQMKEVNKKSQYIEFFGFVPIGKDIS